MGRTILPFRQVIEEELESWNKFKRALRKEDQQIMGELFDAAKYHVAATSYASRAVPLEAIFMAVFIELAKSIKTLVSKIEQLEKKENPNT